MSASEGFRPGGAGDARAIDAMLAALAIETSDPRLKRAGVPETAAALETGLIRALIAEAAAGPIGLCLWLPWYSTWRGQAGAYVQDLYVAPEARGLGLGRRLMAGVLAAAPGVHFLRLSVTAGNGAALRFYAGLGFVQMEGDTMLDLSGAGLERL